MSGSARNMVAQNLADTCVCSGLNDSYGVSVSKATDAKGKQYWAVTFCKARVLDGEIRVYSPNFIQVRWQTAFRNVAAKGSQVFRTELDAKTFIIQSFVRHA